jgi:hypothetical protein
MFPLVNQNNQGYRNTPQGKEQVGKILSATHNLNF